LAAEHVDGCAGRGTCGLDLAWWAVDGETIQITSRKAADRLQRIEFHTIPAQLRQQFANDEALAAALRAENEAAADLFVLQGTHLIVLGNEIVHRTLTRRLRVE
jgi:hypothetical protein